MQGTAAWPVRDVAATAGRLRALGGLAAGELLKIDITAPRAELGDRADAFAGSTSRILSWTGARRLTRSRGLAAESCPVRDMVRLRYAAVVAWRCACSYSVSGAMSA
jgi:hypothetical protein